MSFGTKNLYVSDVYVDFRQLHSAQASKVISLGKEVRDIDFSARPLRHLEKYEVQEANEVYCSDDGVLYSKDRKSLISIPSNRNNSIFIVSKPVTSIRSYAIYATKRLEKLVIDVPIVYNQAVVSCANLREITFGKDVVSIADDALSDLRYLRSILVHTDNRYYTSFESCLYSKNGKILLYVPARLPIRIRKHCNFRYTAEGALRDRAANTELY